MAYLLPIFCVSQLKTVSLSSLFILPFIVQVSLAVGLTGWLSIRNGQRAVNDVAQQLRQEVANRIEQKLVDFLIAPQRLNQLNQRAIELGHIDPDDLDTLYEHFLIQSQEFPTVESIFFGHANGEFIGIGHFNQNRYQLMRGGPSLDNAIHFYDLDSQGQPQRLAVAADSWDTQTRP